MDPVLPAGGEAPVLAVEPKVSRFKATDAVTNEFELVRTLQQQCETQPVTILKPNQVLLNAQGLVQGRYRLTVVALTQLCSTLAPGLAQALQSLAGMRRRLKAFGDEAYSLPQAIALLNHVIKLRFDLLGSRYRFILDRRHRRIEGVVGPKYHFFSNLEMYQRVSEHMRSVSTPATFLEASLVGRRMQLRYKNLASAFSLQLDGSNSPEPFFAGWHYSNSELADCCVKGSCLLLRQGTAAALMAPYDNLSKVVHLQGRRFETKFQEILTRLEQRVTRVPNLQRRVEAARQQSLGFTDDNQQRLKRYAELELRVKRGGVSRRAAKDALIRTAFQGSESVSTGERARWRASAAPLPSDVLSGLAEQSLLSLVQSLGQTARRLPVEQQERAEQTAYRLLVGDIKLHKEPKS